MGSMKWMGLEQKEDMKYKFYSWNFNFIKTFFAA